MAGPEFVTFGCRLNTYESEVMRNHAEKAGLGNAIVFNTCAVTAEATRQARQAIRRARAENPESDIIVTGCAAQTDPDMFAGMPEVTRVLGNEEKMKAESWTRGANERVSVADIMAVNTAMPQLIDGLKEALVETWTALGIPFTDTRRPGVEKTERIIPLVVPSAGG